MEKRVKEAFSVAIKGGVKSISPDMVIAEMEWFYRFDGDNIQGEWKPIPAIASGKFHSIPFENIGRDFSEMLASEYPDQVNHLVVSPFFGSLLFDPIDLLRSAVHSVWTHVSLAGEDIDSSSERLVAQLENFLDADSFEVSVIAPIHNLSMPTGLAISPVDELRFGG